MSERRAVRAGLAGALALVVTQLCVSVGWSLTHDDPTILELTGRCFEREKGLLVEETVGDEVAASASGGTLRTVVEGGLVTIAIAANEPEAARLRAAYASAGHGERLEIFGRYVFLWLRAPRPSQRLTSHDCMY